MRLSFVLLSAIALACPSLAQVIYEPPTVQYGTEDRKFYYGGTDPLTLRRGAFYGIRSLRPIDEEPLRVYTDLLPDVNAATYGFTIDDARNEANAQIPTHFRMSDAVPGTRVENGTVVVPQRPVVQRPVVQRAVVQQTGTITIRPYVAPVRPAVRPVIVIPKRLLDTPLLPPPRA